MTLPWPDLTEAQWRIALQKAAEAEAKGEPIPAITDLFPEIPDPLTEMLARVDAEDTEDES